MGTSHVLPSSRSLTVSVYSYYAQINLAGLIRGFFFCRGKVINVFAHFVRIYCKSSEILFRLHSLYAIVNEFHFTGVFRVLILAICTIRSITSNNRCNSTIARKLCCKQSESEGISPSMRIVHSIISEATWCSNYYISPPKLPLYLHRF